MKITTEKVIDFFFAIFKKKLIYFNYNEDYYRKDSLLIFFFFLSGRIIDNALFGWSGYSRFYPRNGLECFPYNLVM